MTNLFLEAVSTQHTSLGKLTVSISLKSNQCFQLNTMDIISSNNNLTILPANPKHIPQSPTKRNHCMSSFSLFLLCHLLSFLLGHTLWHLSPLSSLQRPGPGIGIPSGAVGNSIGSPAQALSCWASAPILPGGNL